MPKPGQCTNPNSSARLTAERPSCPSKAWGATGGFAAALPSAPCRTKNEPRTMAKPSLARSEPKGSVTSLGRGGRHDARHRRRGRGLFTEIICQRMITGLGFRGRVSYLRMHGRRPRDEEESMADQDDEDKKNMRIMWIASGVIVLFILGLMFTIGAPTPTTSPATDLSSQSRKAPPPN